jgi:hypothetical protein
MPQNTPLPLIVLVIDARAMRLAVRSVAPQTYAYEAGQELRVKLGASNVPPFLQPLQLTRDSQARRCSRIEYG